MGLADAWGAEWALQAKDVKGLPNPGRGMSYPLPLLL